jgi:hypothetical protein
MIQYGQYGDKERKQVPAKLDSGTTTLRARETVMGGPGLMRAVSIIVFVGLALISWPGLGSAASVLRIAGFVDVVPATLSLPLAHGAAPVTIKVQLGAPAVSVPVRSCRPPAS